MVKEKKIVKEKITFNIDKEKNFSEWFSEIIKKAELADIRYNVKGFIVFQPWAVICMEKMFDFFEKKLQEKGHLPYWFPTVIPEKNFLMEAEHVKGFAPEVFWITHGGNSRLEEKLALRPTSETAFYQMFSLWIRSYKDLPFKTYQRAQVFRHDTKATRPFLRGREFYWIETHCVFSSLKEAEIQVREDMETTKQVMEKIFAVPFHFFERPQWDKFPGAMKTFAADSLMPDGKLIQLPSTHLISQGFVRKFGVKFTDKNGEEVTPFTTCYGPAISRIFAAMISIHGDNSGLIFPFSVAPIQVIIIPIGENKIVLSKAKKIFLELEKLGLRVKIDDSDKTIGNKFFFWEMKGVPLRIEIGKKELKQGKVLLFRRDLMKKNLVLIKNLSKKVLEAGNDLTKNLLKRALKRFDERVVKAENLSEIKKAIESGKIVKTSFCSISEKGVHCAEIIEKDVNAIVLGKRIDKTEKPGKKCSLCGKKAEVVVYIGRAY
jgi:prolyl-tRNA synthetase